MGQYGMVLDLNKCLGCQTCVVACENLWTKHKGMHHMHWRNVETRPGHGFPKNWENYGGGWKPDFKGDKRKPPLGAPSPGLKKGEIPHADAYGSAARYDYKKGLFEGEMYSKTADKVTVPPEGEHLNWGANWDEDIGLGGNPDDNYYFYLPRLCNHCTDPACVAACPRHAVYKRQEDGIVLIDQKRCRGYRFCMEACPYKKIFFNEITNTSQKCIFCFPRVEKGAANACAAQCPGRVMFVGSVDDKNGNIYRLVNEFKVALPLHPEYGTNPNIYYIPPLSPFKINEDGSLSSETKIPIEYLGSLFGGVDKVSYAHGVLLKEIENARRGIKSELIDMFGLEQRQLFQLIYSKGAAFGAVYERKGYLHLNKKEIASMNRYLYKKTLPEAPK